MLRKALFPFHKLGIPVSALAFLVFACSMVGNEKDPEIFSFRNSFDTLAQFDSVVILLKDTAGKTIDVLYRGKSDTVKEVENLPAIHWNGKGIVIVSIKGYQEGRLVYHVDKRYDGRSRQVTDTLRIVLPGTSLDPGNPDLLMKEGDSLPIPKVVVTPAEIEDKTLDFRSSDPKTLLVVNGYLKALQRGSVLLTATLRSNPGISAGIRVDILPNPLTPDSFSVAPDTVRLAAGGAALRFSVSIRPLTADPAAEWMSGDPSIARISEDGLIEGLKEGKVFVIAASKRRPSLKDTGLVLVSGPVAVTQVRFRLESLELFVAGVADSLEVDALPAISNQKVHFRVVDPEIVTVSGGVAQGKSAGTTLIIATSAENPLIADSLKVSVLAGQRVDSVSFAPDSVRMYVGEPPRAFAAKVYPGTVNPSIRWMLANSGLGSVDGAGNVNPQRAGTTYLIAQSRVDPSKKDSASLTIVRDVPQINPGRDTVVSKGGTLAWRPGVVQEFGGIVRFRWDSDGDGIFESEKDSVSTIAVDLSEAREIRVGIYAKDTEGNDTTVFRIIRIVAGPAVQILSPSDSAHTRSFTTAVEWTVNGKPQDSLKTETLKLGTNSISRTARDEAGNSYSAVITVFVDTTPPARPILQAASPTASRTPVWTWSGGGGGNGNFKYWLDAYDPLLGKEIRDTVFTPATELSEGIHTLFISERDKAGNWSAAGSKAVRVDTTRPGIPVISVSPSGTTAETRPRWNWTGSGNDRSGLFRYRLDNPDLSTGATETRETGFQPPPDRPLADGPHTVHVQQQDSAGNWSLSGTATVRVDATPPQAPKLSVSPASPTRDPRPTWTWSGAGSGGTGVYRFSLDGADVAKAAESGALAFTPAGDLTEGPHTFRVQEKDSVGNWSALESLTVRIDRTPPNGPTGSVSPVSPTTNPKPKWTWSSGGNGGTGIFRYRLDDTTWASAVPDTARSYVPATALTDGIHVLHIQERDSAGNWSASASVYVEVVLGQSVGAQGFTPGAAKYISLALSPQGVPFVAFSDSSQGFKATVMSYSGVAWNTVGAAGISTGQANEVKLAIGPDGVPHVAYIDVADGNKAVVKKYSGSSWVPVGMPGASAAGVRYLGFVMDGQGVPYLGYWDEGYGTGDGYPNGGASVVRFDGVKWSYVGRAGFSRSQAYHVALAKVKSGPPFIAYGDGANVAISVRKFADTGWAKVGGDVSNGRGDPASMAVNSLGMPWVAYRDDVDAGTGFGKVRAFNGTEWTEPGGAYFSPDRARIFSLAIDGADVPFVAFQNTADQNKAVLVKLSGGEWKKVGGDLSVFASSHISLAISNTGVPYVAFSDGDKGNKVTVVKVLP